MSHVTMTEASYMASLQVCCAQTAGGSKLAQHTVGCQVILETPAHTQRQCTTGAVIPDIFSINCHATSGTVHRTNLSQLEPWAGPAQPQPTFPTTLSELPKLTLISFTV